MMIRYATLEDAEAVFQLVQILGSDSFSYEEFLSAYHHNLKTAHCLVAITAHTVVGLGVLLITFQLHHGKRMAEITELVVDSEHRSSGIGKALVDEMTRIATENHCGGIEVASNRKRLAAHRFYEREGFTNTHCKLTKKLLS